MWVTGLLRQKAQIDAVLLIHAYLFSTEHVKVENNSCRVDCQVDVCCLTFLDHPSGLWCEGAGFACSSLCLHIAGAWHSDLFIWLLPSKLACPLDRWLLCPSSRRAVSLSGTKQLDRQVCRGASYSLSLFLLPFTLSRSCFPFHLVSISPTAVSITFLNTSRLPYFFFLLLLCWCKFD